MVKEGKLIAEGFTEPAGGMHAEKMALHRAQGQSVGATLFVTLEPCAHFGRTPPCTDALIAAGIAEVVYGVGDPNPLVLGKGVEQLKAAGIRVRMLEEGALKKAAEAHLRPFKRYIIDHKPYVVVKVAMSADGCIGYAKKPAKITGHAADIAVHQLRRAVDAVMVGAETARIDNPQLTPRLGDAMHGTMPIRVILSADLLLDPNAALCQSAQAKTWVLTKEKSNPLMRERLQAQGLTILDCPAIDGRFLDLNEAMKLLAERGLTSILVEAGPRLHKSLVQQGAADELWYFQAPLYLGASAVPLGLSSEHLSTYAYEQSSSHQLGDDMLHIWHKRSKRP